ncbi:uncharacterized protein BXZ73DRAFT_76515 [Epithele typhae]|uniref:uncharacterized protein n=1 Tax=Epithele typhae TaxID=378194 RepID=UPI002007E8A8|nr:uncharacterized protein BXZ73DRAFT_76515 [Epithele typhae]KAH9937887.1 hypothetical protein BXZ73DRAFT_76515 [Epithele typhae]
MSDVDNALYCVTGTPSNGLCRVDLAGDLLETTALCTPASKAFNRTEPGAITSYLVKKHDPARKVSTDSCEERTLLPQWMFFDALDKAHSGQAISFKLYSDGNVPSAMERYRREVVHIFGALGIVLARHSIGSFPRGKDLRRPSRSGQWETSMSSLSLSLRTLASVQLVASTLGSTPAS